MLGIPMLLYFVFGANRGGWWTNCTLGAAVRRNSATDSSGLGGCKQRLMNRLNALKRVTLHKQQSDWIQEH